MQQQQHREYNAEAHELSIPEPLHDQESFDDQEALDEWQPLLGENDHGQESLFSFLLHLPKLLPGGYHSLFVIAIPFVIAILHLLGVMGTIMVVIIGLVVFHAITTSPQSSVDTSIQELEEKSEPSEPETLDLVIHEELTPGWTLDRLYALTPSEFEQVVAKMLERSDYAQVEVVGGSGDLCADIKAIGDQGELVVVQCKRYAAKRRVSSGEMQQFVGMIAVYHHANKGIYVTTSSYTKDARKLGEQSGIELIDGERLVKIFGHHHCKDISLP